MRKNSIRELTVCAMLGAIYAVLTMVLPIPQYAGVQIRLAEALTVLPFLFPSATPGLFVGCLIANLLSPYGPVDVIFGTLATAIAAWWTMKMPRWYLAAIPPIVANLIILPPMWAWAEIGAINNAFWAACGFNALTFVVGQTIVCYGLGTILLRALPKIDSLKPMIHKR